MLPVDSFSLHYSGVTFTRNADGTYTLSTPSSSNEANNDFAAGILFPQDYCGRIEVMSYSGGGASNNGGAYELSVFPCSGPRATYKTGNVFNTINNRCTRDFYIRQGNPWSMTFRINLDCSSMPNTDHEECGCTPELDIYASSEPCTDHPVSLLTGNKTEKITDIVLTTPSGSLDFTRGYRQDKLGDLILPRVLGAGWSHNHNIYLDDQSTTENKIYVYLKSGGRGHFEKVTTALYQAKAGGTSSITINTGSSNSRYTLKATDQTFVFDSAGKLQQRIWSNGEIWTYSYNGDKLSEVSDGYGRKLVFAYLDNSNFDNGQLWRVGDHTTEDLEETTPIGRYIEYSYIESRLDGDLTSPVVPLLHTVKDLRGQVWTYIWYGQVEGEDQTNQINFLRQVVSPATDVDGDGYSDTNITVKDLTYILNGNSITNITQKRGKYNGGDYLTQTDYVFQPNGESITTETTAGKTLTHRFLGSVYLGPEDPEGNTVEQFLNTQYRPFAQQDANGNATTLEWSSNGKQLHSVTDALGRDTSFAYNADDTLKQSTDAEGRKTNYLYNPGLRQPTMILISETSVANAERNINGNMEANSGWSVVSTAMSNQSTVEVDTGNYAWYVNASVANAGIQSANWTPVSDRTYVVMARVFPVNSGDQVKMTTNNGDFTATSSGDGAWETLRAVFTASTTTARNLRFLADSATAEFYVDSVHLVEVTDLLRWQEFIYDDKGRVVSESHINVDTASVLRQTTRSFFTSGNGNGFLDTQTENAHLGSGDQRTTTYTYDSAGRVVKTYKSSMFGSCEFNYTLYDDAGNVLGTACSRHDPLTLPATQADLRAIYTADPDSTTVTLFEYDALGRRVKVISQAESPFEQTQLTFYDALNHVHLQISNFVGSGSDQPGLWAWREVSGVWGWYKPNNVLVDQGSNHIQNIISAIHYNDRGLVDLQRTSTGVATYTVYNDADRPVCTITNYVPQGTTEPQDWYWNGDNWQYGVSDATPIDQGIHNDQNLITETVYDPAGNTVKTIATDRMVTLTGYDALNRVVKTIRGASDPDYDFNADRSLANYTPASAVDADRISTMTYDALGRVVTRTDETGQTTRFVYDDQGRQIRTIRNYVLHGSTDPKDWFWNGTNWQYGVTTSTPISHGTNNDQNLISETVYDVKGRVIETLATQDGQRIATRMIFDVQDRNVGTVRNYIAQGASDPNDWSWNGTQWQRSVSDPTDIEHGANNDQNIIARNYFNGDGQVRASVDVVGRWTLNGYDTAGRLVKVINNASDPDAVNLSAYVPTLDPDQDMVTEITYDVIGRRVKTRRLMENRGGVDIWMTTLYGYDILGRQVKTIPHASQPTYDLTSDPDLSEYVISSNPDEDLVTETIYNGQGRVQYPLDVNETKNYSVYDDLGRQRLSVGNYQTGMPETWVWDNNQTRWEHSNGDPIIHSDHNDQNIIGQTYFNAVGRAEWTRDVLGRVTYTIFDALGRQIRTIRNYVAQGASNPADWEWVSNEWQDGASFAIDHGTNDDQNLITEMVYDDLGSVQQTLDVRRNVTYNVYDTANRRVMTIANYVPQGSSEPEDWEWDDVTDNRWEDGAGNAIAFGTNFEQNRISFMAYDRVGRVDYTRDSAGLVTKSEYDALGRQVKTIQNYMDGVFNSSAADEDLISQTVYDQAGQVVKTIDARGTETTFSYDDAGRRLIVTQAANSPQAVSSYTCYDKAGRVLRTIQNYIPLFDENDDPISPDTWTGSAWDFSPTKHGVYNDQNRITSFGYDNASRLVTVTDPVGNQSTTSYFKDAQIKSMTDPEGTVTQYRYDELRRRTLVVQGFVDNGDDPASWIWDAGDSRYEKSGNTAIAHGTNNDENIIVQVAYDLVGRMTSLRNPRGYLTTYTYDLLNRRTSLTNPLSQFWQTAYANLSNGGSRQTMTYPGVNGGSSYDVVRDFDTMGRLASINFNDPTSTPDIDFGYDLFGNRSRMTEYDNVAHTSVTRETLFTYDNARRLTGVGFDTDGDTSVEETISYEYDAGGLRTKMTLPGSLVIEYTYDERGQLTSLTDWDDQKTTYAHDQAGRHIATVRPNGYRSRYSYDTASRLKRLRHTQGNKTFGDFIYVVDKRGNRTSALEVLPHPSGASTTIAYNDAGIVTSGVWADISGYKQSASATAILKFLFFGDDNVALTMGEGSDHGRYDVYIGNSLWRSFDGYATSSGDDVISIPLDGDGPHLLEIHVRSDKNKNSSGNKVRFKQLVVDGEYDLHTIKYAYDKLSRVLSADYYEGINTDGNPFREYAFGFDPAGNRTSESLTLNGGLPAVTNYSYNEANQLTGDGTNTFEFDANGNLWKTNTATTHTWDRANRMITAPGSTSYAYDGLGNRIQQSVSSVVTDYLLDLQPSLAKVIAETTGMNTQRYIHDPRGIFALEDSVGAWSYMLNDGLGSVRAEVTSMGTISAEQHYSPFGESFTTNGSFDGSFGYTGEQMDGNGQVYLRARYYDPNMGVFTALDPWEGIQNRPMSLNGYSWVEGNTLNMIDPSGRAGCGDEPCSHYLNEIFTFVKLLKKIYDDLFRDECYQYEVSIGQARPNNLRSGCTNTDTDWVGHQVKFENAQGTRGNGGLERALRCYEQKGYLPPQAPNPNRNAHLRCDRNNSTYQAALAWRKGTLNTPHTNQRGGVTPPPPLPPQPFVLMPPVIQPELPQDIVTPGAVPEPPIVVVTPSAGDIPLIPSIEATPSAGGTNLVPPVQQVPEPPPPFGRGSNIPNVDCGFFCDALSWGFIASMCLPVGVGILIVAPEVVAPVGGTVCATNPQLCLVP